MKNKKIIMSIVVIIVLIISAIFFAPQIAVLKMENAIEKGNGAEFADLYERWVISQNKYIGDRVNKVVNNWLPDVMDDFNKRFCNGESKEEMNNYLKKKYGSIFISDDINDSLMRVYYKYDNGELKFIGDVYGQRINNVMFGKMYLLRESKIAFVELDIINKIEEYEKLKKEFDEYEPYLSDVDCVKVSLELNRMKASICIELSFANIYKDDTYYEKYSTYITITDEVR